MRTVVRSTDIVVVGAGIVGAAVTYELVRRGASVVLVDARTAGAGATYASGGMLAPYTEAAEGGPLLTLCARSLSLFRTFAAEVHSESGLDINYRETGSLHIARSAAALTHLEHLQATVTAMGVPATRLSSPDICELEPDVTSDTWGGLLLPTQGHVSAPALTQALLMCARRRGATLVESSRVTRLTSSNGRVRLEADGAAIDARTAVVAAGAWSGTLAIDGVATTVPVTPIRGQLLHLGFARAPLSRITWDDRCYLVPWSDGRLLVGATVENVGFDERTTADGVRALLDAVCDVLPAAGSAPLLSTRVGLRPSTPDGLPIIGWSSVAEGVMYATGHYRNGILLAPLTAQLVADAVLEQRTDPALDLTTPSRFGAL